MSRVYTTISEQNTYDIAVEQFGTLNNIDQVLRQIPDLNDAVPIGTDLTLPDTTNNLAVRFIANDIRIATGLESEVAGLFETFDETFDTTFN